MLFLLLTAAAILGDTVNYWIGHQRRAARRSTGDIRFLNPKHLDRTHEFYEKYGGKTIIIARFVPIVRTFAPFVAGIGSDDLRPLHRLQRGGRHRLGGHLPVRAATSSATCRS